MQSRARNRPNILLITTDTQRCDTLACMGSPHAVSPSLDRLAREGVLFDNAHTASPVCSPARCSLLTGLHTPVHGCIENGIGRRTDLMVFPDLLAGAGYHNIMVGKTHFGPVPDSFHARFVLRGEKNQDADDFYAEHIRRHGYGRATGHPNPVPPELFVDAYCADVTMREIDRAVDENKGPFFAFCSLLSPHGPIDPPGAWADLYSDRPLPGTDEPEARVADQPAQMRRLLGMAEDVVAGRVARGGSDAERRKAQRRLYYGLAAYCDAQVGRLLEHLDRRGLRQNTLVIFSSDHGSTRFDHEFEDKHNYYDASWRVPLLLSMPGTLPQGEKRDFAVWNDLTATILGAAGLSSPVVQGFDLFDPLRQGQPSPRRCAVGTLFLSCALATRRWKLEYYFDEGRGRLFDRANDPRERNDLYASADHRPVRDALQHALLTWRCETADIGGLQDRCGGGGPVAKRVARWVKETSGLDAERRLNDRAQAVDALA